MTSKKRERAILGQVYQRDDRPGWYVRVYDKTGKRTNRAGGKTKKEAELLKAQLLARLANGEPLDDPEPDKDVRFDDFLEEHLEVLEGEQTESSFRTSRSRLRNLILPFFKGIPLADITVAQIERFVTKRRKAGASLATWKRDLTVLSKMLQRAVEHGILEQNPARKIKRPKEQEKDVPALPPEVQDALIEAADEKIRDYVLMSLDTGCRQGELLALVWKDVDLARGTLTVTKSKGKRVRVLPLTPRLRKRLAELNLLREAPKEPSDRVLSMLPRSWNGRLRKLFSKAAAAIDHPELVPHDLRHLFATTLASQGVPITTIGALLGHGAGSLGVTMRYARHQPENAAYDAIKKLTECRNRVEEERASYEAA